NAQRRLDRLQVTHFADQHDIGIFTKGGAQSVAEALGVGMQLALVDHTVLVHVNKFDRVLDRQDVVMPLGVDLVDHCCEGCRFASPGGAGNQHQPTRFVAKLADNSGQAKLIERLDLKGNETQDRRSSAALIKDVGTEAGETFQPKREVKLERFLEAVLLRI